MNRVAILLFILVASRLVNAQQVIEEASDPRATRLLDKLNQKFGALPSYEMDFRIVITNPEQKKPIKQSGKFVKSGAKYRVFTHDMHTFCNGEYVWIFKPKENTVQLSDMEDTDADFIHPDQLFSLYKSGEYLYHFSRDAGRLGKGLTEIEFKPVDRSADFFKIKMVIDTKTVTPQSFKIFYKDGTRVTMTVSDIKQNKTYPDGFFTFDKSKHPNAKIEDLRL